MVVSEGVCICLKSLEVFGHLWSFRFCVLFLCFFSNFEMCLKMFACVGEFLTFSQVFGGLWRSRSLGVCFIFANLFVFF